MCDLDEGWDGHSHTHTHTESEMALKHAVYGTGADILSLMLKPCRMCPFFFSLSSHFLPISHLERGKERVSEGVLSGLDSWPFHSEWMGRRVEDLNKQTA